MNVRMTEPHFRFSPMTPPTIAEYSTWFTDPELARRLGAPTEAWIAYVTAGPRPAAWAVYAGDEFVGHIQVEFYEHRRCSILIAVKPSCRGQGLSAAILAAFIESVVPDQRVIEAGIEQDNIASIRAAEKAGFTRVSAQPDADGFIAFELYRN
jgi:RimJ/RimL family protein N-acetyltransferase